MGGMDGFKLAGEDLCLQRIEQPYGLERLEHPIVADDLVDQLQLLEFIRWSLAEVELFKGLIRLD